MIAEAREIQEYETNETPSTPAKRTVTIELSQEDAEAMRDIAEELEISEEDFVSFSVRYYLQTDYYMLGREAAFRAIVNVIERGKVHPNAYLDAEK